MIEFGETVPEVGVEVVVDLHLCVDNLIGGRHDCSCGCGFLLLLWL